MRRYAKCWKQLLLCSYSILAPHFVKGLSLPKTTPRSKSPTIPSTEQETHTFSVSLINARPKPQSAIDTFIELWNDPRPVTSLFGDRTRAGQWEGKDGKTEDIPYCIVSEEFQIGKGAFQILLYPRGRFVGASSSLYGGLASAYLRYLPEKYGDEIDIAFKLRLCVKQADGTTIPLQVATSGGLPKSDDTWSAAMTFCTEFEALESVGRATDWGSTIWSSNDVCAALGNLVAEGEMTIFASRQGENSFSWPPLSKGAIGAIAKSTTQEYEHRDFRAGEVIVPRKVEGYSDAIAALKDQFVYPGIDYRIMTMTDQNGKEIFSTKSLNSTEEKSRVRLALRPCGWQLQWQFWRRNGMKTDWPVEVEAGLLSNVTSTRFDAESVLPRLVAAFQRDWIAYTFFLAIAITPIPFALFARTFVSFYAIPSASMEPTLLKGDVLLVEKLPGVYERTKRGDVILFQPPSALRDIVTRSGSQLSSNSLFVKRIVGLPGDKGILLGDENDVTIDGKPVVGPDRSLCQDEPLRLIDKLLETGKGKDIETLEEDDVYVLGDCKAVSVDSRVFGTLPKKNIVGRPVGRIWPLDRIQLNGRF